MPWKMLALLCVALSRKHSIDAFTTTRPLQQRVVAGRRQSCLLHHHHPDMTASSEVLKWIDQMSDSYEMERGESLREVLLRHSNNNNGSENPENGSLAELMKSSPLAIASHDFLRRGNHDAVYNYGNPMFLQALGYDWEEFVELPSRYCVGADKNDAAVQERQQLLDQVATDAKDGDAYDNLIRVRKNGDNILLQGVHLWNVYDGNSVVGQAVWIQNVTYL